MTKRTVTSFIIMLWRFIKGPVVALLTIWRLLIRVLPVTCREHDSTHAKTPVQKANPTYIQKTNYYPQFEATNIHNACAATELQAQTTLLRLLTSILCKQHRETPWRKFALFPQHTAIALSEIWNFGTPKGTVWTQTQWEETELRPMSVFCSFFSPILFISHNKGKKDDDWEEELKLAAVNLAQACGDCANRKWHDL